MVEAIWANKDHDAPVKLTGVHHYNGDYYFTIEGSRTGIPYNEVKFINAYDKLLFLLMIKGRTDIYI